MEPATATLLAAGLATAGSGVIGYAQGKQADKEYKYQKYRDKKEWLMRERERAQSQSNFNTQLQQSLPGQSLGWLQALQGLRQGNARSTGLDVLQSLSSGGVT